MVQCEMCGKETNSPSTVKVEGAKLDVCDDCTDFGTEVKDDQSSSSTSTKYSTSDSSGTSSSASNSSARSTSGSRGSSGGSTSSSGSDMFGEVDELAQDYDQRIRSARENAGLSQDDLAKKLNEKSSLIRKLEHGDSLPSDSVQGKIESALDIDLTTSASGEDGEWEGSESTGEYTLGDMVERNDS
jgi:putative transcription factor